MNNLKIYTGITAVLWVTMLYFILFYINKSFAIDSIPSRHINAVGLLYVIYYSFHVLFIYWFLSNKWSYRIIAVIGCVILISSLFPVMFFIIQDWMPRYNLQLFRDDVTYDEIRFQRRLISAYIFVVVSALLTVIIGQYIFRRRAYHLNIQKLISLQKRLVGKDIKTHFIKNLLSTNFGLILLQSKPEQKENILNTIGLLAYFMRIEKETENVVSLDEEIRELQRFIRLLDKYYGDMTVIWEGGIPTGNNPVPLGLLLLPLENVLKYAKISRDSPILIEVQKDKVEWIITYKSIIDNAKVKRNKGSGTGISNMIRIINMLQLSILINTIQENEMYVFRINIKFM